MLNPVAKLFSKITELYRIGRVRALHHHTLKEIAAEPAIRGAEPLVESKRVGVRNAAPHGTERDESPSKTGSHGRSDSSIARLRS